MSNESLITRRQIIRRVTVEAIHQAGRDVRNWVAATFHTVLSVTNIVWSPVAHAVWVCTKDREELDDRFAEHFEDGEDR